MKNIFFSLLAFLTCSAAGAQIITTVAGNGTTLYNGDTIAAIAATLYAPSDAAFDMEGNMYISDGSHYRIRKVNTAGVITTIAGNGTIGYSGDGGPATAAQVYGTLGILFDNAHNMYFADSYNHCIRKINTDGIISTIAGTGVPGYNGDNIPATAAQLYNPHYMVFDAVGNMYITDFGNWRIRKINTSGIITTIAGTGVEGYGGDDSAAISARMDGPYGLALDNGGNIYFADFYNNVIRKIDAAGIISTIAGTGNAGYSGDGAAATSAWFKNPAGILIGNSGNIYVADVNNHVIREIDSTGMVSTIAGTGHMGFSGDGGPATAAKFNQPASVSMDNTGSLYVADFENNRIRMIKNTAAVTEISIYLDHVIYPNPSNGRFNVAVKSALKKEVILTITDGAGRQVEAINGITNTTIPVAIKATAGAYYLTITVDGRSCTDKIIIE